MKPPCAINTQTKMYKAYKHMIASSLLKNKFIRMKKNFFLYVGLSLSLLACIKTHAKLEDTPEIHVNYTFPVKDSVFTRAATPSLDLDKDGRSDFTFSVEMVVEDDWKYTHYYIVPKNENEVILLEEIDAQAIDLGTIINATTKINNQWSNNKGLLLEVQERAGVKPVWTGNWSTNTLQKHYLPVRLKKNNKFYYGWIEMHYNSSTGKDQFVISSTAVHELPDEEIKAGK